MEKTTIRRNNTLLKFIIIAAVAWILGVFGWAQIIGSLQNIKTRKSLAFTLVLWIVIMAVGGYIAIAVLQNTWALVVGYLISFIQVKAQGRIS